MRLRLLVALLLIAAAVLLAAQNVREFRVDPALTTITVQVGRAGLFSFAGHEHEVAVPAVEGRISLDAADPVRSRVSLQFDTRAMKVTGRGEPAEDVPEVQRTMLSERVLDAERYPTIAFESDRIAVQQKSADGFALRVEGRLTLHGTSRSVTVPVAVRLSGGRLTATGTATVRQSDFGIRPVAAGAGTVKVKDEVTVTFTVGAVGG